MKNERIIYLLILSVLVISTLCSCKDSEKVDSESSSVTLTLFSNLPDRKNGQGLIEQMIIDEYESSHPNIHIEVECLEEEAYKTKFRAYAMDEMPDVVSIWGEPSFLDDCIDAGILMELDEASYQDYGFKEGSLEGFKKDGRLYGLPRNTDMIGFYYNKAIFEAYNLSVPETFDEYYEICRILNENDIIPISMDGLDGWPLVEYYDNILYRLTGDDRSSLIRNSIAKADFSDPEYYEAMKILKKQVNSNFFQEDFVNSDYGTAISLFTEGKAAMYYMGSWEASMEINEDLSEDFRSNIGVFSMPAIEGEKGSSSDAMVWFGGGYALSSATEHPEEALDFLNYLFDPSHLSTYGWEHGVGMSAQDQDSLINGTETETQKAWLSMLNEASSYSGTPINDLGSLKFKETIETNIGLVAVGQISPEAFFESLTGALQ